MCSQLTFTSTYQVKLLWHDPQEIPWEPKTAYRWTLVHEPDTGLIRISLYDGINVMADSGDVFDTTISGGRLGVYCDSQVI